MGGMKNKPLVIVGQKIHKRELWANEPLKLSLFFHTFGSKYNNHFCMFTFFKNIFVSLLI